MLDWLLNYLLVSLFIVNVMELAIIGLVLIYHKWHKRSKTIIISPHQRKEIALVYNQENSPKLPWGFLKPYTLHIPEIYLRYV